MQELLSAGKKMLRKMIFTTMLHHHMNPEQKTTGRIRVWIIASLTLLRMLGPQNCKSEYQYEERFMGSIWNPESAKENDFFMFDFTMENIKENQSFTHF